MSTITATIYLTMYELKEKKSPLYCNNQKTYLVSKSIVKNSITV